VEQRVLIGTHEHPKAIVYTKTPTELSARIEARRAQVARRRAIANSLRAGAVQKVWR
jgi:hypothetical protein